MGIGFQLYQVSPTPSWTLWLWWTQRSEKGWISLVEAGLSALSCQPACLLPWTAPLAKPPFCGERAGLRVGGGHVWYPSLEITAVKNLWVFLKLSYSGFEDLILKMSLKWSGENRDAHENFYSRAIFWHKLQLLWNNRSGGWTVMSVCNGTWSRGRARKRAQGSSAYQKVKAVWSWVTIPF